MEAYKFDTIVRERGIIQIPEIAPLENQNIEVFIVVKTKAPKKKPQQESFTEFLDEWTGFLKGIDPDELKAQYLEEKYG